MLELVAELRGHDSQVWSVVWRPATSQLTSCGGKRVLLWTNESIESDSEKDGQAWKLKSVVLSDEDDADFASEYADIMGSMVHLSLPTTNSTIDQVNLKSVPLTNSGTHERTVRNLGWTSDGKVLAMVSFDATGSIWTEDIKGDWRCRAKIEGHENEIKAAAWSPSRRQLATCSRDKTVWVHSLTRESDLLNGTSQPAEFLCSAVLSGHSQDVKNVIWHPTQDLVVSASYDNSIRLWAPWTAESLPTRQHEDESDSDWQCITTLEGHLSTVWSVSFAPSGLEFASASDDKTVRIWTSSLCSTNPPSASQTSLSQPSNSSSNPSPKSTPHPSSSLQPSPSDYRPPLSPSLEPKRGLHPWLYVSPAFRSVTSVAPITPPLNKHIDIDVIQQLPSESVPPTPITESSSDLSSTPLSPKTSLLVSNSQWYCSSVITGYHDRTIYCVAWHPQLNIIATASGDDSIRIFQRSSSSINESQWLLLDSFNHAHSSDVNAVSWKSIPEDDGSWLLASAGDDGVVRVFKFHLQKDEIK